MMLSRKQLSKSKRYTKESFNVAELKASKAVTLVNDRAWTYEECKLVQTKLSDGMLSFAYFQALDDREGDDGFLTVEWKKACRDSYNERRKLEAEKVLIGASNE